MNKTYKCRRKGFTAEFALSNAGRIYMALIRYEGTECFFATYNEHGKCSMFTDMTTGFKLVESDLDIIEKIIPFGKVSFENATKILESL
jgi:hypothetical protein